MFQVTIHGRGGQGVVTAAEVLARTAFAAGFRAQAIPTFGAERTGAPVQASCRIDTAPILTRQPVLTPDAVVVQDPTLLRGLDPFHGLARDGIALVNTTLDSADVCALCPDAPADGTATVPADAIVAECLGLPKPSIAMLGGLAALVDVVALDTLCAVVASRFPGAVADRNAAAARAAYAWVSAHRPPHAPVSEAATGTREDARG